MLVIMGMQLCVCSCMCVFVRSRIHCRLLEFYVLATSAVISGRVPTCNSHSVHSWWLGDQAASTMIWYPNQLPYPDAEPASPCPVLNMLKYQAKKPQISIIKVIGLIQPGIVLPPFRARRLRSSDSATASGALCKYKQDYIPLSVSSTVS